LPAAREKQGDSFVPGARVVTVRETLTHGGSRTWANPRYRGIGQPAVGILMNRELESILMILASSHSAPVVDARENPDRMNRWKAEVPGPQPMARPRSRIRVILILLLESSLACFPARPLPLLGSSLPSLRHTLDHLCRKPVRLQMFDSGPSDFLAG